MGVNNQGNQFWKGYFVTKCACERVFGWREQASRSAIPDEFLKKVGNSDWAQAGACAAI